MAITQKEADEIELAFIEAFNNPTDEEKSGPALDAWNRLYALMERENRYTGELGIDTIDWQIGNWAGDVTLVLHNAQRYGDCIKVNEQILKIYWYDDDTTRNFHENALRDIADEYFYMGNKSKALELYEKYLIDDPLWGWGWVGYYRILEESDDKRYEPVLNALYSKIQSGTEFRDEEDLLMDLDEVFEQRGEKEKASYCHSKRKNIKEKQTPNDEALAKLVDALLGRYE